jgi:hypothetical protein
LFFKKALKCIISGQKTLEDFLQGSKVSRFAPGMDDNDPGGWDTEAEFPEQLVLLYINQKDKSLNESILFKQTLTKKAGFFKNKREETKVELGEDEIIRQFMFIDALSKITKSDSNFQIRVARDLHDAIK